jgi:hypothetical protein
VGIAGVEPRRDPDSGIPASTTSNAHFTERSVRSLIHSIRAAWPNP